MPPLFCLSESVREAGEWSWWRIPQCLRFDLTLAGKRWFGSLMCILLNRLGYHATSWQLAWWLAWLLEIGNWCPFAFRVMMTEIVGEHRLISCLLGWPKSSGYDSIFQVSIIWIGDGLASPPPYINKLSLSCRSILCYLHWEVLTLDSSSVVLLSRHVSFSPLHQMEKGKVERMMVEFLLLGSLLDAEHQSSRWACHKASVFVTMLRRWGQFAWWLLRLEPMIWFWVAHFLGGENHSKESDPPSIYGVWGRKLFGWVCWRIASHPGAWSSSPEYQSGGRLSSPSGMFVGICLVGVAASLLEGFLGIAAESGAGLVALDACELLSRNIAAWSGVMVQLGMNTAL